MNPTLGEVRKTERSNKVIWAACLDCGVERWVQLVRDKPRYQRCHTCENKRKAGKGGRIKASGSYVSIRVYPEDFFYPMADIRGYIYEHRLVVAKALGRCLHRWEIVHHKKGAAKDDNRYPETLQLVTDDRHKQITILENRIKWLEERVLKLEVENVLLKQVA